MISEMLKDFLYGLLTTFVVLLFFIPIFIFNLWNYILISFMIILILSFIGLLGNLIRSKGKIY